MSQNETGHPPDRRCRLLRIEQAAVILNRSQRTVRYHARKRRWTRSRGLVREDDVIALKVYLEDRRNTGQRPWKSRSLTHRVQQHTSLVAAPSKINPLVDAGVNRC